LNAASGWYATHGPSPAPPPATDFRLVPSALLSGAKTRWRGTLVMVGQPAEEVTRGAKAMIDDGLLTRFPKPDHAIAVHVTPLLPAGQVGIRGGPVLAAASTVEIIVHGRGGHGAYPHLTVDPVLLASRIVVALQGIVAREINPLDPGVVTVGSIHGGTKSNIIPDEVKLQLTVRSYKDEVQKHLLDAIARVAKGEAQASGAPREPTVTIMPGSAKPTINNAALAERLRVALSRSLGASAIGERPPIMASEDFSEFGYAGVPSAIIWVGAPKDAASAEAAGNGAAPGLHTARFTPDVTPTSAPASRRSRSRRSSCSGRHEVPSVLTPSTPRAGGRYAQGRLAPAQPARSRTDRGQGRRRPPNLLRNVGTALCARACSGWRLAPWRNISRSAATSFSSSSVRAGAGLSCIRWPAPLNGKVEHRPAYRGHQDLRRAHQLEVHDAVAVRVVDGRALRGEDDHLDPRASSVVGRVARADSDTER